MAPSAVDEAPANGTAVKPSKANIGVFTNPNHDLWMNAAEPSLESVNSGEGLKPGEVTIAIRSTGICGYATGAKPRIWHKEEAVELTT
jgi:L-iditol 2-dehydrogenase